MYSLLEISTYGGTFTCAETYDAGEQVNFRLSMCTKTSFQVEFFTKKDSALVEEILCKMKQALRSGQPLPDLCATINQTKKEPECLQQCRKQS